MRTTRPGAAPLHGCRGSWEVGTPSDITKVGREVYGEDATVIGMTVHTGNADAGHYYAFAKDRCSPKAK